MNVSANECIENSLRHMDMSRNTEGFDMNLHRNASGLIHFSMKTSIDTHVVGFVPING